MNFKFKRFLLYSALFVGALSITSCGMIFQTINDLANDIVDGGLVVINDKVAPNQPFEYTDKSNTKMKSGWDYDYVNYMGNYLPTTPSTGDVTILVVPVELTEKTGLGIDTTKHFTSTHLNGIKGAFNGINEDGSNSYWESVKSFYEKSSYGNLHLNFEITDPYKTAMTKSKFESYIDDAGGEVDALINEIYSRKSNLKIDGVSVDFTDNSKYDANDDGYIDGVWFVYNIFSTTEVTASKYWAYTSNYFGDYYENHAENDVMFSKYANFGYTFLSAASALGYDAHTAIHETGHMLGLDDYYSYDLDADYYGAMGGLDMMDNNVGDHSAFSKFALGWVEANVMFESSSTFTLKPFEDTGDCLILPANYFNNTAFSEYLIIQYYTPTKLNKLDSERSYKSTYPKQFSDSGVLIYHVDARVAEFSTDNRDNLVFKSYISDTKTKIDAPTTSHPYYSFVTTSNTPTFNYVNQTYSLVQMMSGTGRQFYGSRRYANNDDLFKANKNNVFDVDIGGKNFANKSFNDGTKMSYKVTINSMDSNGVNISVTR